MITEDRDRILQLVRLVQSMDYQSRQAMMDGSNYDRMFDALQEARKLLVPITNSLREDVPPDGYYAVFFDDRRPSAYYLWFSEYGVFWGYDERDDGQRLDDDDIIVINGAKRRAGEFAKDMALS